MPQEVCSQDRSRCFRQDENPSEGASQPEIEGEGACAKGRDWCVVDGLERKVRTRVQTFLGRRGEDAHLSPRVDEELGRCNGL